MNLSKDNKLLVITPFYNREEFLKDAIESILNQTHQNLILVLVDDASEDSSKSIAEAYVDNEKVYLLTNNTNMGCYYSRNKALEFAKVLDWNYWSVHDSDDTSDPTRFEILLTSMNEESGAVCLVPFITRRLPDGYIVALNHGEGVSIFHRVVFNYLGYYDNTRFAGDTEYLTRLKAWIKVYLLPYKIIFHDLPLYHARRHDTNLTSIYGYETHRGPYVKKFDKEISRRKISGNFFTNFKS